MIERNTHTPARSVRSSLEVGTFEVTAYRVVAFPERREPVAQELHDVS